MNSVSMTTFWWAIPILGLGTFLLRYSFLYLTGKFEFPVLIQRLLKFIPASVLAALILPAIVFAQGAPAWTIDPSRLIAGAVASIVAWRTRNMLATIGVGMLVLWSLQAIFSL